MHLGACFTQPHTLHSLGRVHEHLHGGLVELVERGAVLVAGGVGRLPRGVAHGADRPQLVDRECPHYRPLHRQHPGTAAANANAAP